MRGRASACDGKVGRGCVSLRAFSFLSTHPLRFHLRVSWANDAPRPPQPARSQRLPCSNIHTCSFEHVGCLEGTYKSEARCVLLLPTHPRPRRLLPLLPLSPFLFPPSPTSSPFSRRRPHPRHSFPHRRATVVLPIRVDGPSPPPPFLKDDLSTPLRHRRCFLLAVSLLEPRFLSDSDVSIYQSGSVNDRFALSRVRICYRSRLARPYADITFHFE